MRETSSKIKSTQKQTSYGQSYWYLIFHRWSCEWINMQNICNYHVGLRNPNNTSQLCYSPSTCEPDTVTWSHAGSLHIPSPDPNQNPKTLAMCDLREEKCTFKHAVYKTNNLISFTESTHVWRKEWRTGCPHRDQLLQREKKYEGYEWFNISEVTGY